MLKYSVWEIQFLAIDPVFDANPTTIILIF